MSDTEYIPTIEELRADFVLANTRNHDAYQVGRSLASEQETFGAQFDRTLAAHDREVAAKALREFADTIEPITTCPTDVRMARARAAALVSEPSTPDTSIFDEEGARAEEWLSRIPRKRDLRIQGTQEEADRG